MKPLKTAICAWRNMWPTIQGKGPKEISLFAKLLFNFMRDVARLACGAGMLLSCVAVITGNPLHIWIESRVSLSILGRVQAVLNLIPVLEQFGAVKYRVTILVAAIRTPDLA